MERLLTTIKQEGQRYVDRPVFARPADHLTTTIAESLAEAFGHVRYVVNGQGVVERQRTDVRTILVRHERVHLRWMTPDGEGGLVPKAQGRK